MEKMNSLLKPAGKIKISKIFVNSKNGQMTVVLPKRKMKVVPSRLEVSYW